MNPEAGYFLIAGIGGVLLRDMLGIMRDVRPCLSPRVADTLADAAAAIGAPGRAVYAFLYAGPDDLDQCDIGHLLAREEVGVILLGPEAEDAAARTCHPVLVRPFGQYEVLDALEKLGNQSARR